MGASTQSRTILAILWIVVSLIFWDAAVAWSRDRTVAAPPTS